MSSQGKRIGKLFIKYIAFILSLTGSFVLLTGLINGGLKSPHFPTSTSAYSEEVSAELHYGSDLTLDRNPMPWTSLLEQLGTERAQEYEGVYWVRMNVSELDLHAPSLWIRGLKQYEVYVDNQSVYRFNMDRSNSRVNTNNQFHPIPLAEASTVHIRVVTHEPGITVYPSTFLITNTEDAFSHILRQNAVKVILGILFLFLAIGSFTYFSTNRKQSFYLYFALMNLGQGLSCLIGSTALNYYIDTSALAYYRSLLLPFSMLAYLAFLDNMFGRGYRSLTRRILQLMLIIFLTCAAASWLDYDTYQWLTGTTFQELLVLVLLIVTFSIMKGNAYKLDGKMEWLLFGNGITILFWVHRWIVIQNPSLEVWVYEHWPLYSFYWQSDIVYLAGFIFVLCTGFVLRAHLTDLQTELSRLNRSLEEQVLERTADLEETHKQLQTAMRETYEALGEVAILEERTRISNEIHDILGHKLTGSIMQLEASKRLMLKDLDLANEKIDAALESIRKGLADVRAAVHLMKDDFTKVNLEESLLQLVEETEKMTGVAIERSIHDLPQLDAVQKKVLYHALQEGLTNGIKHGGCQHFNFHLCADGSTIEFTLYNDGAPVSSDVHHGFGLTAMGDRIKQLGGSVQLSPSHDVLIGSVLKIRIPLKDSSRLLA